MEQYIHTEMTVVPRENQPRDIIDCLIKKGRKEELDPHMDLAHGFQDWRRALGEIGVLNTWMGLENEVLTLEELRIYERALFEVFCFQVIRGGVHFPEQLIEDGFQAFLED